MSTTTTNYNLIKPALTDAADITAMNPNWDTIDLNLHNSAKKDLSNVDNVVLKEKVSDAVSPNDIGAANSKHASQHDKSGIDPITPAMIGANPTYLGTVDGSEYTFNTALTQGEYSVAVASGNVDGQPAFQPPFYGKLLVFVNNGGTHNNSSNWIWQVFLCTLNGAVLYRNKVNNGQWNEWTRLYNQKFKPTSADVGAEPAFTTLPTSKGGTGANTRKEAMYNMAFLGVEPIDSTANDTPANWSTLGTGYAWYGSDNRLTDQPTSYAILVNLQYGSDITQLWFSQPIGRVYKRSGSFSGWDGTWFKSYDEKNKPTPSEIGAVPAENNNWFNFSTLDLNAVNIDETYHYNYVVPIAEEGHGTRPAQYWLNVVNYYTPHFITQVAYSCYPGDTNTRQMSVWTRERYIGDGNSWSDWVQMYNQSYKPTPQDIGAIDENDMKNNIYYHATKQLSSEDLNTIVDPGYYFAAGSNTCANSPVAIGTSFGMEVSKIAWSYVVQTLFVADVLHIRYYNGNTWQPWKVVYTSGKKPTPTDIGAQSKITYGTEEPTGGNNGDVYIQIVE